MVECHSMDFVADVVLWLDNSFSIKRTSNTSTNYGDLGFSSDYLGVPLVDQHFVSFLELLEDMQYFWN